MDHIEFLAKIGKKGGSRTSTAKKQAGRVNAAKAVAARWKGHIKKAKKA